MSALILNPLFKLFTQSEFLIICFLRLQNLRLIVRLQEDILALILCCQFIDVGVQVGICIFILI